MHGSGHNWLRNPDSHHWCHEVGSRRERPEAMLRFSTGGWSYHGLRVHRFGLPGAGHRAGGAEGEPADGIDRPAITAQSGQSCVR
jgi:hypothetical protein